MRRHSGCPVDLRNTIAVEQRRYGALSDQFENDILTGYRRLDQTSSQHGRARHDDLLHWQPDWTDPRSPASAILLVGGRSHVWQLDRLLVLHWRHDV